MDSIRELVHQATSVNSIWSIVLRGLIWLIISLIIIISMDHPNTDLANKKLKANLGFFLIFMVLSGGLVYLLFGFAQS
jgi:uncharacterized integral membrane protein